MMTVFTDGGARGNPGPAAIGCVIVWESGEEEAVSKYIGEATNNVAEYTAVIEALTTMMAKRTPGERGAVAFCLDSQLVVEQLNGRYKVKDATLQKLWQLVQQKRGEWGSPITFSYIPRERNRKADALVNQALDREMRRER